MPEMTTLRDKGSMKKKTVLPTTSEELMQDDKTTEDPNVNTWLKLSVEVSERKDDGSINLQLDDHLPAESERAEKEPELPNKTTTTTTVR